MSFLVRLAFAQVRHHLRRWLLYAAGVALVVAVPVLTAGSAADARRDEITHAAASLAVPDRMIAVTSPSSDAPDVTHQLARLTSAPVRRQMAFRELTSRGEEFFLGAADALRTQTRLTAGAWPSSCTPTRCEAVVLGNGDSPAVRQALADLGVVITGSVERTDPLLLGGEFDPGDHRIVLGSDVTAMGRLASLSGFSRHVDQVTSLDAAHVRDVGVPAYVRTVGRVGEAVQPSQLVAPTDALRAADARGAKAGSRFVVLDALFAALLAGFVVLAAAALRREGDALAAVLRRRGARPAQSLAVVTLALGLVTLAAAVVGIGVAAVVAQTAAGIRSAMAFAIATLVLAEATLVLRASVALRIRAGLELLAVAGLVAAIASGERDGRWLVPPLACLVAGLVAARLVPAVAGLERWRLPVTARIALAGRTALAPVATGALVAAALAAVTFVGGYRATIDTSARDQAAWTSPLASVVSASIAHPTASVLVEPGPGVLPVVRTKATLTPAPGIHVTASLLGVPPAALTRAARWEATSGSSLSASTVSRRLQVDLASSPVVSGAVSLPVSGAAPDVEFSLWLRSSDGRPLSVPLVRRGDELTGTVPPRWPGLHVTELQIAETAAHQQHRLHATGEGTADVAPPAGSVTVGDNGLGIPAGVVDYRLDGGPRLVPTAATSDPLPIAVDRATARLAQDGRLRLSSAGGIVGRVVAVLPGFPSVVGRFIVADRDALLSHLDAVAPGQNVTEFWTTQATEAPGLTTVSQAAVADQQRYDPIVAGTIDLLMVLLALALALLLVALVLFLVGERRDAAGELFAWEADGLSPRLLRSALLLRVVAVVAVAAPIGLVAGLLLVRTTAGSIAAGAWGVDVHPTPHGVAGWGWATALAGLVLALAVVAVLAGRMLRERWPVPQEVDLR
ncbi:hypothetical protein [Nocardioides sp. Kera G14]|uniref:hypothetical protein n=1 Tax=Nocardioides sp. Kera G14 TaxID=2884264 RepID=UPI001D12CDCC|nr:hypothetical protein [Nocardioides sp. Kera G14]UDY22194.1 hypothetical protein LH076_08865 [Nocardioides sp. Kera G14]